MLGSIISAGASLLGGSKDRKAAASANEMNAELQREFAQNGIRWKVEDAKAAGVSPLFALGAQTHSFSPSLVGKSHDDFSRAGQDIGRAVDAGRTVTERNRARADALTLERGELENQLLRSQIAKLNQPGHPPARPVAGISDSPMERSGFNPSVPFQEPGAIVERGFTNTSSGGLAPVPGSDAKQRIEDSFADWAWSFRNLFLPNVGLDTPPSNREYPLPSGYRWRWSHARQEYRPSRSRVHKFLDSYHRGSYGP